jgi:hypothetical protein
MGSALIARGSGAVRAALAGEPGAKADENVPNSKLFQ